MTPDLGCFTVFDVDELFTGPNVAAFLTLTALEIVLGIDNVVFIAILVGKLPEKDRPKARQIGLGLAMIMRIMLLLAIGWVMGLTAELFGFSAFWTGEAGDRFAVSGRDLILLVGGLFLIGKATYEIHDKLEGDEHAPGAKNVASKFATVIVQILLLDIVFSLDSVITAVGMVSTKEDARWVGTTIMITAVVVAVGVMLIFAGKIASFVDKHPTMKILALSFLIMIGVMLVAEGLHAHIPKGYVYFSMAFALAIELLNMRFRKVSAPVKLHQTYVQPTESAQ